MPKKVRDRKEVIGRQNELGKNETNQKNQNYISVHLFIARK